MKRKFEVPGFRPIQAPAKKPTTTTLTNPRYVDLEQNYMLVEHLSDIKFDFLNLTEQSLFDTCACFRRNEYQRFQNVFREHIRGGNALFVSGAPGIKTSATWCEVLERACLYPQEKIYWVHVGKWMVYELTAKEMTCKPFNVAVELNDPKCIIIDGLTNKNWPLIEKWCGIRTGVAAITLIASAQVTVGPKFRCEKFEFCVWSLEDFEQAVQNDETSPSQSRSPGRRDLR